MGVSAFSDWWWYSYKKVWLNLLLNAVFQQSELMTSHQEFKTEQYAALRLHDCGFHDPNPVAFLMECSNSQNLIRTVRNMLEYVSNRSKISCDLVHDWWKRESVRFKNHQQECYSGCIDLLWWRTSSICGWSSLFTSKLCIVTYGHELWVATEIILLRVQAVEMGFLLRLTVCDKVKRWPGSASE